MSKHNGHTPGPWKATSSYGIPTNEPWIIWDHALDAAIAHVYNRSEAGLDNHVVQHANAALIAAAPDLLACVNMVLDAGDDNGDMGDIDWDMLRAAIAKAEGGAV